LRAISINQSLNTPPPSPPKAQINTDNGRGVAVDEFITVFKLMLVAPSAASGVVSSLKVFHASAHFE
jgi:hypothetical protein